MQSERGVHTPAFETGLIASHGREVLPDPLEHFFALLDAGEGRRVDGLKGSDLGGGFLVVGCHVT